MLRIQNYERLKGSSGGGLLVTLIYESYLDYTIEIKSDDGREYIALLNRSSLKLRLARSNSSYWDICDNEPTSVAVLRSRADFLLYIRTKIHDYNNKL